MIIMMARIYFPHVTFGTHNNISSGKALENADAWSQLVCEFGCLVSFYV